MSQHATPETSRIVLAHGGGGQLTDDLIASTFLPRFNNDLLNELLDSAIIPTDHGRLALTIDGYVVQPLQFPGGDIGRLAISGTVNDLAVSGATPLGIALGVILAEGLDRKLLDTIMDSLAATAREANVRIVTGDTKVVGHNQADGIYITTAGVGWVPTERRLSPKLIEPGDAIIVSGTIADHGLTVMLAREMPEVRSVLRSDVAPLNSLIASLLERVPGVKFMRDPTRGGLAGVVADLAQRTGLHISLIEEQIPLRPETQHAADMLGLDPLEVANEGKIVAVVAPQALEAALAALHAHPLGKDARHIGHVESARDGICEIVTPIGGRRILQKPYGEQLPRIC